MKNSKVKKTALAGIFCAIAIAGSMVTFPVFGSRCAPVQHMVNILCAILLGPWYGVLVAIISSLLRNMFGLGTLMAFPGSMFGALLSGIAYRKTKHVSIAIVAEILGTTIIGGLVAYPVSILFMGKNAGELAFYTYMFPFLLSTAAGSIMAGVAAFTLNRGGLIQTIQQSLDK